MIVRTTKLVAWLAGGLILVSMAVFGGLYFYLSQGPISLSFVKAPFERIINANLGGIRITIRDAVIEREEENSAIRFRLRGIVLQDANGIVVARAPRAAVGVTMSALLRGRFSPTRLELIGPRINLTRDEEGGFKLGFDDTVKPAVRTDTTENASAASDPETTSAAGLIETVLSSLANPGGASEATAYMEEIAVRNAIISLYDENNQAEWYASKADLYLSRIEQGVSLSGSMTVESGDLPWRLNVEARYRRATDDFTVSARIVDFVPAEVAGKLSVLSNLTEVRLPLSGRVALELDRKGVVTAAEGHFGAGAGYLGFQGVISEPILIDEGQVNFRFDPATGAIELTESKVFVGETQAVIDGRFRPVIEARILKALEFDLNVHEPTGGKSGGMFVDRLLLGGTADLVARQIDISRFAIEAGDARVVAAGRIIEGKEAPGFVVRGKIANLPFTLLKKLWPPRVSPGAREWVFENVSAGVVTDADVKIDLTPEALTDALNDRTISNDFIDVVFNFRNTTARYFGELPVFQAAEGTGRIRGDEFELTLNSARVDVAGKQSLKVSKGRFFVNDFARKGPLSEISGVVTGATAAALRVLDHPPLGYMKKFGLDPDSVGGNAAVALAMRFPLLKNLPVEAVGLKARAQLSGLSVPGAIRDAAIEDGTVTLDVDTKGISGKGDVVIAGIPARLQWTESFEADSGESSSFVVETTLDDKQRRKLGIDLSEFLSGPVPVRVTARGKGQSIDKAHVDADLSKAVLYYRPIGWVYPSNKKASASFDVEFSKDFVRLRDLRIKGPNLSITGAVRADNDGRLLAIDLTDARLGPNSRISVKGQRGGDGVLQVEVNAPTYDARALLKSRLKQAGSGGPATGDRASEVVIVKGAVARAKAYGGETFSNVSFSMRTRGDILETLSATGNIGGNDRFKVALVPAAGGGRSMRIDASNAGRVLRAVDLYSKVEGGDFKLLLEMPPEGSGAPRTGELKLKRFSVKNEQALREIKLNNRRDLLAPKGKQKDDYGFDSLTIPFVIRDDVLEINQALLKGSAIGASAQGSVDTSTDQIEIGGTLIPAYELNSFISHVPLVGDVLTGGKGQGVFGMTFAVTGTTEQPRIQINPVSALMPGILRKVFEFGYAPRSGQSGQSGDSDFGGLDSAR